MYLQHFHATMESMFYIKCRSAVTGSPQITKTALSWVGLGFVAKVPWGEMGVGGAYHSQAEKCFGHCRFAKSAARPESKILIAHIFPNSSILLAWQCLWNPKQFSLRCQVSTLRMAQHGGCSWGLHCWLDWWDSCFIRLIFLRNQINKGNSFDKGNSVCLPFGPMPSFDKGNWKEAWSFQAGHVACRHFSDAHVVQWQVAQLSHKACWCSDVLDSLFGFKIAPTMLHRLDKFGFIMIISNCLVQCTPEYSFQCTLLFNFTSQSAQQFFQSPFHCGRIL